MIYSKSKYELSEFHSIIGTYVESGIPIIGVLQNEHIGHAVNIVGRENIAPEDVLKNCEYLPSDKEHKIIDFNKLNKNYIIMDDNHPPYQITSLEEPCKKYYSEVRWHDCEITNIIVPLYPKIYLDANRARNNFIKALETRVLGLQDTQPYVMRTFLASSRSYKDYFALKSNVPFPICELILRVPMPKFVWVAELSKAESYKNRRCDVILIQDATEPVEYREEIPPTYHPLLAGFINGCFFKQSDGKFVTFDIFAGPFEIYDGNLQ